MDAINNTVKRRMTLYGRLPGAGRWLKTHGTSLCDAARGILTLCRKRILILPGGLRLLSTYHRCSNTSLFRFMEAMRGELKALRRGCGFLATKKTLSEARALLMTEYCELSGSAVNDRALAMRKELVTMRLQIEQLTCLLRLVVVPDVSAVAAIKEDIFSLTGLTSIEAAAALLTTWTNDYSLLLSDYEKERQSDSDEKKADISGLVVEVQKYLGFRINPHLTTVWEFAGYEASFNRYVDGMRHNRDSNL